MCLLETLGSEVEYKNRQSLVFKIDLDFLKLHNGNKEVFSVQENISRILYKRCNNS